MNYASDNFVAFEHALISLSEVDLGENGQAGVQNGGEVDTRFFNIDLGQVL